LTAFWIDVAVLGTIAFCTWRGYKSGLLRGVFGVVALIAALLFANIAAQAYSDEAESVMMPFVSGIVESAMTEMTEEGIEYQALAHDHEVEDVDFGRAYTALRHIGLPEAAAVSIAAQTLEAFERDAEDISFSDLIAKNLTSSISFVTVFGIAFLLISIIFAVIGNLIGFVFSLPGLKLVDIICGSVFGLFKGLIIVFAIAVIIRYFGLLILPTLENTTILNYFVNNNPIADMLGI
jgi:uncharacterized membrane protein required for colicin V production